MQVLESDVCARGYLFRKISPGLNRGRKVGSLQYKLPMPLTERPISPIQGLSAAAHDNRPRSRIIVRARGGWGRRLAHCRRSPSHPPHAPTTGPISRIIVRARGGWGRRLAHCRRSPSHPPHAPTTGQYHASSYGHEGDGGDVSPIVADLRPIPLMPRQPAHIITTSIVRARGGWGRRLAYCRRSPSHPPHAPTTGQYHEASYGHEGDGGDVSPIVADLRPIPLMPRQSANITHHRTGTRGIGARGKQKPPGQFLTRGFQSW